MKMGIVGRVILLIVVMVMVMAVQAQVAEDRVTDPLPHPYVFGGANLVGGGSYQPFSYVVGGGLQNEYHYGFWAVEGLFSGNKKTINNVGQRSGYTERTHIWGGYRYNDWMLGAGVSYSLLHTNLYSKDAWHPRAGFGHDGNFRTTDYRLYAEYVFPGTDTLNGVQGGELSFWLPSIRNYNRHWFWRERVGGYFFHQTLSDIHDVQLVARQKANRSKFSEVQFTIMYRW